MAGLRSTSPQVLMLARSTYAAAVCAPRPAADVPAEQRSDPTLGRGSLFAGGRNRSPPLQEKGIGTMDR